MKFTIKALKPDPEPNLEFSLEYMSDGGVRMTATDDDGHKWAVVGVTKDGYLVRYSGLNEILDVFKCLTDGRVATRKESLVDHG